MYALITRDLTTILKKKAGVTPIPPENLAPTKPYWVPYLNITNDTSTGPDKVYEDPVENIYADRVERVSTIRDMTAQELDDQDTSGVDSLMDSNGINRALAQVVFQLVNDVRTLNSQATITPTQFKTYLKGLIRS